MYFENDFFVIVVADDSAITSNESEVLLPTEVMTSKQT